MRRYAYGVATVLVTIGVALHFPDYLSMADHHYMMSGMPMGGTMTVGMLLIVAGMALAIWGFVPSRAERSTRARRTTATRFVALDRAELTPAHRILVAILTVGLIIDMMKPASLGFVAPGMVEEYGLARDQIALLPFAGITGTVTGSLVWGYLADLFGRRSTILLSALMYVGTAICGFMPSFGWNLAMCFVMGLAAGGMLPIVYSLMSETVPAKPRGWLLVLQAGLGAALGYVAASGAAALLIPHFSWRILWLLGAPTGVLLILLSRWIPESPRFLLATGRDDEAARVMARYGVRPDDSAPKAADVRLDVDVTDAPSKPARLTALLTRAYRTRTAGIVLYGAAWGIVNWSFITFLPVFLEEANTGTEAGRLLFTSSLLAVPATVVAAVLYARWSSRRTMLVYAFGTAGVLLLFTMLDTQRADSAQLLIGLVGLLLASAGGMIALLSPYATEVYPTSLRATGSGLAAAASKVGGMFGPMLLTSAPRLETLALIVAVPVVLAAVVLWRTGLETAGKPLVESVIAKTER